MIVTHKMREAPGRVDGARTHITRALADLREQLDHDRHDVRLCRAIGHLLAAGDILQRERAERGGGK